MLAFLRDPSRWIAAVMHVLVVDSNPGVLVVAKKVLARAGVEVITAGTVEEGIARANRHAPDLLLLDGAMATSGVILEFAWATSRRMPILLMIPKGHEDELRQALRIGRWEALADVVTILEKPLAPETLLHEIKRVIEPQTPNGRSKDRRVVHADLVEIDVDSTADDDVHIFSTEQETPEDVIEEPLLPRRMSMDIVDDEMYAAAEMPEGVRIVDLHAFQTHVLGTSPHMPPRAEQRAGAFAALLAEVAPGRPVLRDTGTSCPASKRNGKALPELDSPWTDVPPYPQEPAPDLDASSAEQLRLRAMGGDRALPDPAAETAAALLIELSDVIDSPNQDALDDDDPNAFPTVVSPIPRPAPIEQSATAGLRELQDAAISAITDPPAGEPPPNLVGEVVLSGRVGGIRIEQVLQLAADASAPTCLRLENGPSVIDVFFDESKVVFARRHQPADWDALDLWIDERLPDPRDNEDDEPSFAERQAELAIYEAVRWTDARFTITENEPLPEQAEKERVELALLPLVLEGARRLDEWRKIAGELSSRSAIPGRVARPDEARILSSLSPDQRRLLEEVDGRRSVEEIVKSVQQPPLDVLKALRRLRDERLVTLVEKSGSA